MVAKLTEKSAEKAGWREGVKDAGKQMLEYGRDTSRDALNNATAASREMAGRPQDKPDRFDVPSYRKGGKVRHSGAARLHKGEKAQGRKSKGR